MDITIIAELLQIALPTGLIIIGVWFAVFEFWPYYKERDIEQMRFEQTMRTREVESDTMLATAITALAKHIENPIKVQLENTTKNAPDAR
jgi:hypothetical protein